MVKVEKINSRINSSTLEIIEQNATKLEETEIGKVTIKPEKPIVIEKFTNLPELGRFVFVKDNNTVAGGIVI